jgi:single-strand DNA-binding protein
MDNFVQIVGNITADPELRGTEDSPRCAFTVIVNKKVNDEERSDAFNVTCFGTLARNMVSSLKKGQRVVVSGSLSTYKKEVTIEGEIKNITMVSINAQAVAPDLRWARAEVTRIRGNSGNDPDEANQPAAAQAQSGGSSGSSGGSAGQKPAAAPPASDNPEDF